ncbi:UNVERIFIED_CONTAM: hypothetical protein Sradi_6419000 [Sesamum radiatum]|uniref:Uncharacterized protein n=1 Tax=Sesamum radiatum TaxID=300843 RepID=A0AAW2K4G5_SESRA
MAMAAAPTQKVDVVDLFIEQEGDGDGSDVAALLPTQEGDDDAPARWGRSSLSPSPSFSIWAT